MDCLGRAVVAILHRRASSNEQVHLGEMSVPACYRGASPRLLDAVDFAVQAKALRCHIRLDSTQPEFELAHCLEALFFI